MNGYKVSRHVHSNSTKLNSIKVVFHPTLTGPRTKQKSVPPRQMTLKGTALSKVTSYCLAGKHRIFVGNYSLRFQSRRVSRRGRG